METGVAYSTEKDSHKACREVIEESIKSSGQPTLTFLFTTDSYNQQEIYKTSKQILGSSKMAGFCAGGIITPKGVLKQGIGACTLHSDELKVATHLQRKISKNPYEAGKEAGKKLLESGIEKGTIFIFPDGFATDISEVVYGLYDSMGSDYTYIGGAAGDNLKFFKTYQFTDEGIDSDALSIALIDGIEIKSAIGHGWKPEGSPMIVTSAVGKRVFEIDGKQAFSVYSEKVGGIPKRKFAEYSMQYPIGISDIDGNFLIRDPLSVNEDGSIDFVSEVPENAVVNVMKGNIQALIKEAYKVAKAVSQKQEPKFLLIFDCISRYMLMGKDFEKELHVIKETMGTSVSMLGVLTFGEIGSYTKTPLFHNKTLALSAVYTR